MGVSWPYSSTTNQASKCSEEVRPDRNKRLGGDVEVNMLKSSAIETCDILCSCRGF